MSEFKNKTILITGGARGLGFGIASAFAHEGANLVLTDIIQDTLETAMLITASSPNLMLLAVTFTAEDILATVKAVVFSPSVYL